MNGPMPIQINEVMAYCAMAGVADPTMRMGVLQMVQAMDGAYLQHAYEQAKRERGKAKTR